MEKRLTFDEKIIIVYDYLCKNGSLPLNKNSQIKFSDGADMRNWIYYNRKKIQAQNDFRSAFIIEYLDGRKKMNFEDKVAVVYNYLINNTFYLIKGDSKFNDGTSIKKWLFVNKIKLEESDDFRAREIIHFLENEKQINFENHLLETYNYLQKYGELPSTKNRNVTFSDGTYLSSWLLNYKEILKQSNDFKAIAIVEYLDKRKKLSFDQRLTELYEQLQNHGSLMVEQDLNLAIKTYNYLEQTGEFIQIENESAKFSDGLSMKKWINNNKKKLNESDDFRAKEIIKYLSESENLSFDEKVSEAYNYLECYGKLPLKFSERIKFSDGGLIAPWFYRYRVKLMKTDDFKARAIVLFLKNRKSLTFDEKLKELCKYLKDFCQIPINVEEEILFSDGINMASWAYQNKYKIYYMYMHGDDNATEYVNLCLKISQNYFDDIIEGLEKSKRGMKK